ncbi:uncharacterized protein METZ01_LOCUS379017, partial [marine metagenome]
MAAVHWYASACIAQTRLGLLLAETPVPQCRTRRSSFNRWALAEEATDQRVLRIEKAPFILPVSTAHCSLLTESS